MATATPDKPRRRKTDRGLRMLVRDNWYRDVWLLLVTFFVLIAVVKSQVATDRIQHDRASRAQETIRNTKALCALRGNLERRGQQSVAFLAAHPAGVQGISTAVIVKGIRDTRQALHALSVVHC